MKSVGHTGLYVLKAMASGQLWEPRAIAAYKWPTSKQLDKKERTIRQYMNQLVRTGFLRKVGEQYILTPAGRSAADGTQHNPPVFMRLATY